MNMTVDEAKEHGEKAGRAINQKDQSRYSFEKNWFREAVAGAPNKTQLQNAWDAGYTSARQSEIHFQNLSRRD